MLFMGQKPGSMCLEEQVEAVQPRQVGGEAAHQQVGGDGFVNTDKMKFQ